MRSSRSVRPRIVGEFDDRALMHDFGQAGHAADYEALSLEDEARDVLAVLDAAGSERAVLMGYTTGGPLAITTAAPANIPTPIAPSISRKCRQKGDSRLL